MVKKTLEGEIRQQNDNLKKSKLERQKKKCLFTNDIISCAVNFDDSTKKNIIKNSAKLQNIKSPHTKNNLYFCILTMSNLKRNNEKDFKFEKSNK